MHFFFCVSVSSNFSSVAMTCVIKCFLLEPYSVLTPEGADACEFFPPPRANLRVEPTVSCPGAEEGESLNPEERKNSSVPPTNKQIPAH